MYNRMLIVLLRKTCTNGALRPTFDWLSGVNESHIPRAELAMTYNANDTLFVQ